MHKCIPYANNNIFMMIRNWVLTQMGGTDKSVPYEIHHQIPICLFAVEGGKEFLHIFQKALDFPPGGRFIL